MKNESMAKQESSWQHEDNLRAEKERKEGHYGYARALDKDADSAGHGHDWTGIAEQRSFAKQFSDKSPVARFKDFDQMDTWDAKSIAMKKGCQISKHSSSNFKK
jgi:hypothetical protein